MMECDQCNNWYHPPCVGLTDSTIPEGIYICPVCQEGLHISYHSVASGETLANSIFSFQIANAHKLEEKKTEDLARKYTPMTKKELREELGRRGLIKKVSLKRECHRSQYNNVLLSALRRVLSLSL